MMYLMFLLATYLSSSSSWVINVNENVVVRNKSTNITIECVYDQNNNNLPQLIDIYSIRISKFKTIHEWTNVAKISALHPMPKTSLKDAIVTGHAKTLYGSFLKIDFPVATMETMGQYICQIDGYGQTDKIVSIKTKPVVISERVVNYDYLLTMIKDGNEDIYRKLKKLESSIENVKNKEETTNSSIPVSCSCDKNKEEFEKFVLSITDKLTSRIIKLENDLRTVKDNNNTIPPQDNHRHTAFNEWPTGTYALLKPESGCPKAKSLHWTNGLVRLKTDRRSKTSTTYHFQGPVVTFYEKAQDSHSYTVELRYCVKTSQGVGPVWPAGQYCIQAYEGNNEVNGFNFSHIQFETYHEQSHNNFVGNFSWYYLSNNIVRIGFWCRNDSDANIPIVLPPKNPFYLFRFGGSCQQVSGMTVTDEWVYVDTTYRHDGYSNPFHPDGNFNRGVKLQMCYYNPF